MQPVEHIHLEQLLVAHPNLDRVVGGAVLIEPVVDQWHIHRAPCAARPVKAKRMLYDDEVANTAVAQKPAIKK